MVFFAGKPAFLRPLAKRHAGLVAAWVSEIVGYDARCAADNGAFNAFSVKENFASSATDCRANHCAFKIRIDFVAGDKSGECSEHGERCDFLHDELPFTLNPGAFPLPKVIGYSAINVMTFINPPCIPASDRRFEGKHVGPVRKI